MLLMMDDTKSESCTDESAAHTPDHLTVVTNLKCFACNECFSNKQQLKHHVVKNHKNYVCPFCEKVFRSKLEWKCHFLEAHN